MIRVKSKQLSNARTNGDNSLVEGWVYQVECTACGFQGSVFSTFANLELLEPELLNRLIGVPHECIHVGDDDETTVTNMTQVFDEHLGAALPQPIIEQLENLPHLRRLGQTNLQRLQVIMDLMRHPNNMLQLWVWTRMAWAFGGCDARVAAANFSALMATFEQKQESEKSFDSAVKGQALIDLLLAIHRLWTSDRNFPQWNEYNAFMNGVDEDDPNA